MKPRGTDPHSPGFLGYTIQGSEKAGDGYFIVRWSPIAKADKYDIVTKVPALGGIAELYFRDRQGKLNLFCLQRSWYGGVRSMLRERSDPELEKDLRRRAILEEHQGEIYYRYVLSESAMDMKDVMFFFMETYSPGSNAAEHSDRYGRIYLREIDAGKLTTI
jgi:hypothetical protein